MLEVFDEWSKIVILFILDQTIQFVIRTGWQTVITKAQGLLIAEYKILGGVQYKVFSKVFVAMVFSVDSYSAATKIHLH